MDSKNWQKLAKFGLKTLKKWVKKMREGILYKMKKTGKPKA